MLRKVLLLLTISSIIWSVDSVTDKHSQDPSVPDETDMSVIDEFMKSDRPQGNGYSSGNPSRGSLDNDSTTTSAPTREEKPKLRTESGEECKCVKYYSCTVDEPTGAGPNGTSLNSTEEAGAQKIYDVVDIRKGVLRSQFNSTESLCESYFDICCPLNKIKEKGGSASGGDSDGHDHEEDPKIPTTTPRPTPSSQEGHRSCGHRNENGVGFKMTGATENEAQFGEFPWTVALIQIETNEDNVTVNKYVGGGALLHPQVVLTVAHNVLGKRRSSLKVRLGEWDTQTNDEPYPSQDRGVQKVIIHEQFLLSTLYNDIALLILDEEARFASNVDTICLPPLNNKKLNFDGQMCYSAGWGKDHFGAQGRYSEIMKRVSVPVVPKDKCQEELSKSEKLPKFRLDKSFMCAGGGDTGDDTCKGDGGAALACSLPGKEHSHYVVAGLVSWGLGCGSAAYPAVYTDVHFFTPWILKHMDKEEMSTEYCSLQN